MRSFLQAMMMKGSQKDHYSLARTSEDDLSKDGLLEKEGNFYEQRPSFWRRNRNMVVAQVVLLTIYTLAMYLVVAKIRSQCLHGPNLVHCTPPVEWQSLSPQDSLADCNSSCKRSGHLGRTRIYSRRQNPGEKQVFRKAKSGIGQSMA